MQQEERVAKLIEWFVKAALRHAEAVEAMHEEAAAVQAGSLDRFFAALQAEEGGMDRFLNLLDHENPVIAGMAAVYAMLEAPERSKAALERVAREPGLIGFRAQIALERRDSGEWQR